MTTATILATIDRKRDAILSIIPRTYRAALHWEAIRSGIGLAISRSEKLQQCDAASVYTAVLDILRFGLDPSGVSGQAFLVPYYDKRAQNYRCQAIIGQQGKIELAFRTGRYSSIITEVVHENDVYSFDLARRHLSHTYDPSQPRGASLFAYCRIWLVGADQNGPPAFQEVMGAGDFAKIADGKTSPAYRAWRDEMFRRSVLARCLKRSPKSADLAELLSREAELASQEARGIVISAEWETAPPPEPRALPEHVPPPDTAPATERAPAYSGGTMGGMP